MSAPISGLFLLGCGGHARSVADVAVAAGVRDLVFVDANVRDDDMFLGFGSARSLPAEVPPGWSVFPAVGDHGARRDLMTSRPELRVATVIAPTASVGLGASIGAGTLVAHQAHLGPATVIGRGVIVNSGAVIDHDSVVGDFSHVSVHATVAGRCRIGSFVMIGAGATVIDGITICDQVTVGAGATVVGDITEPGTYVGTPAGRRP